MISIVIAKWPNLLSRVFTFRDGKNAVIFCRQLIQDNRRDEYIELFERIAEQNAGPLPALLLFEIYFLLKQFSKCLKHGARLNLQAPLPNRIRKIYAWIQYQQHENLTVELGKITASEQEELFMAAIRWRSPEAWLHHVNQFLRKNTLSSISLKQGPESLFQRLHSTGEQLVDGPLVSIVMSAFNCAPWIRQSVQSVCQQTYRNFELLIFDDCSTDATSTIIRELAKADSRIRIFKNTTNWGTYVSRNIGLRLAKGQYFTTQDSDDWAHPQRIERQVKTLIENNNLVGCTARHARMEANGQFEIRPNGEFLEKQCQVSLMLNREVAIELIGYWDCVRASADSEYIRRIIRIMGSNAIENLTDFLLILLSRENQLTMTQGLESRNGFLSASRIAYIRSFREFHNNAKRKNLRIELFGARKFPAPDTMIVEDNQIDLARDFLGRYL